MLFRGIYPFPILPPPGGWDSQVIPFMLGLGVTDAVGILLGMSFSYQAALKGKFHPKMGIFSLTIFITGAVVFAFGTFPSGAWAAHPIAYGIMAILFFPAVILYAQLLRLELYQS